MLNQDARKESDFNDVPVALRKTIINDRLSQWRNTQFQAWVDLSVARKIPDKGLEDEAMKRMRNCEAAIKELEDLLKMLDGYSATLAKEEVGPT